MASADQVLQVNRLDGDAASTFSCRSDGFPQPTITWSKEGGLPVGVTSRSSSSEQILEWNRNLEYTDSGTYTCIAQNGLNTSMGTLNLLVISKFSFKANERINVNCLFICLFIYLLIYFQDLLSSLLYLQLLPYNLLLVIHFLSQMVIPGTFSPARAWHGRHPKLSG